MRSQSCVVSLLVVSLLLGSVAMCHAGVTVAGGGLVFREEGGTFAPGNLSASGSAFAFNIEGQDAGTPFPHNQPTGYGGAHTTTGVNNLVYGNSGAWLAGSAGSFVGINLGAAPVTVQSVAFGRDNPGQFVDRSDGRTYTLQYTTTPNPNNMTAAWTTIGTISYAGNDALSAGTGTNKFNFNALRHLYDFTPVSATGLRIVASATDTGIDEFELYNSAGGPTAPVTLVESGGVASVTGFNHASQANGGTAFAQDAIGSAPHTIPGVNDGVYGNASSWIGAANGRQSYVGVDFTGTSLISISSIAFSRDNNGVLSDRNVGNYILQYTTAANPSASSVWNVIDGVTYSVNSAANADRHRYAFNAVNATGIRLQVSNNTTAIDELEVFGSFITTPAAGKSLTWNGNDGANFSAGSPALVPNNLALASNGAIAFSDGDLGGVHSTADLNNGLYGNSNSWISDADATSFAGVDLPGTMILGITSIAFGRDNGDNTEGGGQLTDRSLGVYTLQFTLLDGANATTVFTGDPNTGWADIGTLNYLANVDGTVGGFFTEWLRHEFNVLDGGSPLLARGIRIMLPNSNAIDELEVFGSATLAPEPSSIVGFGIAGLALAGMGWRLRRRRTVKR